MKLRAIVAAMSSVAILGAGSALASNEVTSNISVEVMEALSLTETSAMAFPVVFPGNESVANDAPAAYAVNGSAEEDFTVSVPADTTLTNGTDDLVVSLNGPEGVQSLDLSGDSSFEVTGELVSVPASTGQYEGSFVVAVEYVD